MIRRLFGRARGFVRRAVVVAAVLAFGGPTCGFAQQPPILPPALEQLRRSPRLARPRRSMPSRRRSTTSREALNTGAQSEDGLVELKRRLAPLRDQLRDRSVSSIPASSRSTSASPSSALPPDSSRPRMRRSRPSGRASPASAARPKARSSRRSCWPTAPSISTSASISAAASCSPTSCSRAAPSLFDPRFWRDLAEAVPAELRALCRALLSLWTPMRAAMAASAARVAALAILAGLGAAAWFAARWVRRLTAVPTPRRFDKALAAMVILGAQHRDDAGADRRGRAGAAQFRPDAATRWSISAFGLGGGRRRGRGSAAGVARGAVRARRRRRARIIAFADREAESYAAHLIWAAHVVRRRDVSQRAASGARLSARPDRRDRRGLGDSRFSAIIVHLLWRSAPTPSSATSADVARRTRLTWLRGILWLVALAIATSLAAGYVGFAVFSPAACWRCWRSAAPSPIADRVHRCAADRGAGRRHAPGRRIAAAVRTVAARPRTRRDAGVGDAARSS